MSERYRDSLLPQAMTFTCLVALQFKHKHSKSQCQYRKKQELWKNNINICVDGISCTSNGAKRTFEMYN